MLLGTLTTPNLQWKPGCGKTKDLVGKTTAQHVRIKIYTFCSHPLQNNIITSPKFAWNSTLPTNIMLQLRWGAIM